MKFSAPERLVSTHDTTTFENGKHPSLDDWLRRALEHEATSRTFVVCERDTRKVVGYHALATGSIGRARVPTAKLRRGLPSDVPVILLARLAVDKHAAGRGLGHSLIADAFDRILSTTASVGAMAIVVHAIDSDAAAFYRKFDFVDLQEEPSGTIKTMFLPIAAIAGN